LEISQFELVYKPQSPSGTADTVLQGYFLEISNLEDIELQFSLSFTTSIVTDPDRSLDGNTTAFIDTPDGNNSTFAQLTPVDGGKSFGLSQRVIVPAHGTALVAVLPSDPFPPDMVPGANADFECRGYVTITLPTVFRQVGASPGGFPFFSLSAQLDRPAKVMLTPQLRALYSDPVTGAAKGQTQSSMPLATGQSLNEIEPMSPFIFRPLTTGLDQMLSDLPFEETLAGMLAVAQHSEMDLSRFNKALKETGIGMAIETRKLK